MATSLEDLRVLKAAETLADELWPMATRWDDFARDTLGKQLVRAVDSIGANIAESFGRYSYGEKLQFLYYARGSLFECKFWLNRALARDLITAQQHEQLTARLSDTGRQINAFANGLKAQRSSNSQTAKSVLQDERQVYEVVLTETTVISQTELIWLSSTTDGESPITNLQSPISNL